MQPSGRFIAYARIFSAACILLLLVLMLFQWIWVLGGSGTSIMDRVGLQRNIAERIAKDAYILEYRPVSEHPQAINELQNMLPIFERIQQGLQAGDAALGLPRRPPDIILQLMLSSQPDYISIDTAARQIIKQPDTPVDKTEIDIIANHERGYFLILSQVDTVWEQYIDGAFWQIFVIEEGLTAVVLVLVIGKYVFVSRRVYSQLGKQEE